MTEIEFWKKTAELWNPAGDGVSVPRRQVTDSFDREEDGLKEAEEEMDDILAELELDF